MADPTSVPSSAHSSLKSNEPQPASISRKTTDMKDISAPSNRYSRNTVYPKKRPSPHGISKSHKTSAPLLPAHGPVRRSPRSAKSMMLQQKQREVQIAALRKEGVLLEEEYREDIQYYMLDMERFTMASTNSMDQQPEIKWHMRPCLVDFLVEIHFTLRLRPETLYLTLNIIDRYVSRRIVYIKHYQLVGCAALWIASKFEDAKDRIPSVQDLVHICRDTYEQSAFVQMEEHVLSTIQWSLGHPTAEAWLRLLCCGPCIEDIKVQHVARFLMEITLFYREFVKHVPSAIALGALTLARFLCGNGRRPWEETKECLEIVDSLDNRLAKHVNDLSETLVKKYSYAFYSKAATFVVEYYLKGGRFIRELKFQVSYPVTPTRSPVSAFHTPMSTTTSLSDISDDMPLTPTSPNFSSDPFTSPYSSEYDKENFPSSDFEPIMVKHCVEATPDKYLPHDYVTFGRSVLSNLNGQTQRTMVV